MDDKLIEGGRELALTIKMYLGNIVHIKMNAAARRVCISKKHFINGYVAAIANRIT